eukprot:TRINITY_DN8169_c0_g1_i1.p1 TRINITY_DN8169_c0_g1~~TRINITY_DN8169_c0_g1_i1.p1  ORF type:complete len:191 (-),score=65.11 TRINITY_DN8169_c0_g1_i1:87-659(-)
MEDDIIRGKVGVTRERNETIEFVDHLFRICRKFSFLRYYLFFSGLFELFTFFVLITDGLPNSLPPLRTVIGEGSLVRAYLLIVFTIGLSRIATALDTYNRSLYIFNLVLHIAETIFFISESAFNGTISWDMIDGLMRLDPTVISENGDTLAVLCIISFHCVWMAFRFPEFAGHKTRKEKGKKHREKTKTR